MDSRRLVVAALIAIVGQVLLPFAAAAQAQSPPSQAQKGSKPWTLGRTPWGHPDLEGVYSNSTIVPLERPAEFAGRAELTDAEVKARFEKHRSNLFTPRAGDTGFYNEFWWEWGKDVKRTSLIIDPPDGKLPLTPQGLERGKLAMRRIFGRPDGPEDLNVFDRCITRSLPGAMMPGFYSHYYQFLQTPDYVVILMELIHDVRVIPLTNRPHIDPKIGQWLGDSRGRWEGDTLVVETTNLNDKVNERGATLFGAGAELRLVERFTRTAEDTIDYQFTVHAPSSFTKPWTASIPFWKTDLQVFEYACHEGNYAMPHSLSGARAEDAAAAAAGKKD
jgi:hypothetical protein